MFYRKTKAILILTALSAINLVFFENCGVQKPKVDDLSSLATSFNHSPIPTSCISCHSTKRPPVATTLAADGKSDLYPHTSSYNGTNDCVQCHTQNQADIGKTWKNGLYNHKSSLGVTVANCTECHVGNKPLGLVGSTSFDHATIGTQDCFNCHKNAGANWSTTVFSHSPTPTSCNSCHSASRPAPTIYNAANPAQPTLDLYVHASQYNGSADCVACHTSVTANVGIKWAGGVYSHQTDTGAAVANCINCHTGSRPATHTAATGQTGDCVSCHTNAGVDWSASGGSVPAQVTISPPSGFSLTSITVKHPTVQSGMACTTCHSNYNSANSIKGFDHNEGLVFAASNAPVNNSCYYCHVSPNAVIDSAALPNNSSRTFSPGKIVVRPNSHHGETLSNNSSCLSCHSASSPPSWNSTTKAWTTGGSWNGG